MYTLVIFSISVAQTSVAPRDSLFIEDCHKKSAPTTVIYLRLSGQTVNNASEL